jgi:polyisoprenyl-teichoic acid--peptidoglycan teichoic acid transferase
MAALPNDQPPPRVAFGLYKRALLALLVIVLSTSAAVATAALLQVKTASDIFSSVSKPIPGIDQAGVLDGVDSGGPQTILVLGSDRRFVDIKAKTPTRSDTIILLRLDPSKGATAVMSLPRDLRVEIPGHGMDKINAAYADGGPALTVRTVRKLLGISINHVVNVNFGGFQRAVNRLGCVYADVDRRYFNDNRPPVGGGPPYSVIDVPAGYQKLCGKAALEYVRYRHLDSDVVRGARQQDFLRQAKEQIGVSALFSDRNNLIRIFGAYTDTDIKGTTAILRLLKLAVESAKNPLQEVHIADLRDQGADLVASPDAIRTAARQFLDAQASKGPRATPKKSASDKQRERAQQRRARRKAGVPAGLIDQRRAAEDLAVPLDAKVPFPVYFPKLAAVGSTLRLTDSRVYDIFDRGKHRFRAFRIVVNAPGTGQNYGVQGMSWKSPPILDNPSEKRRIGGRTYELFFDGDRLRLVAWRTPKAVYWVSNTLLQTLTNQQMLAIAGSLTRVGAR